MNSTQIILTESNKLHSYTRLQFWLIFHIVARLDLNNLGHHDPLANLIHLAHLALIFIRHID